jgi:cytochrome c-type biogenesis protein CcmH/NrfG
VRAFSARLFRCAQREPENAGLLASYAVFLWEARGDAAAASTLFDAAAALDPQNLDVLASRAYYAMLMGV